MLKFATSICLLIFLSSLSRASSPVDVLYVESYKGSSQDAVLYTYNVDPDTATTRRVGQALHVPTTSIDPLTIGSRHVIYLWNGTDVWKYNTSGLGVPESQASQHLVFGYQYPVVSFVTAPDGQFAYAVISWTSNVNQFPQQNTEVVLLGIDQSTGDLIPTGQVVASYTKYYYPIYNFQFGASGRKLYFVQSLSVYDECGQAYNFYPVNRQTGDLGPFTYLFAWGEDCGTDNAATVSNTLTAVASAPDGQGSGSVVITRTSTEQTITCGPSMLAFCGDNPGGLSIDPRNQNLFFGDLDTGLVSVGHIDFAHSELLPTTSSIPATGVFFSPDSRLVYSFGQNDDNHAYINIYAFDANVGDITASSVVATSKNDISLATATLGGN
jgi:hypothetical protein